jgi:hypothetical protein
MTQGQIAAECKCNQSNISQLFKGVIKNPGYTLGLALLALHKKQMRKQKRSIEQAA